MDIKVIETRLQKLDSFVRNLHHDYLEIDSEIVHAALAGEVADFKQFAAEIMTWLSSRPYGVANP